MIRKDREGRIQKSMAMKKSKQGSLEIDQKKMKMNASMKAGKSKLLEDEKDYFDYDEMLKSFAPDVQNKTALHKQSKVKYELEIIENVQEYEVSDLRELIEHYIAKSNPKKLDKFPNMQLIVDYFEDDRDDNNYKFIVIKELVEGQTLQGKIYNDVNEKELACIIYNYAQCLKNLKDPIRKRKADEVGFGDICFSSITKKMKLCGYLQHENSMEKFGLLLYSLLTSNRSHEKDPQLDK